MSEVEIIKTLKSLGFTEYQSRIYLTLSTRGPLNPTEISTIANMPRPNVYPSLERLVKEGLVLRESVGRGPRYLAVPFPQVSNILNNDLENKMKLLEQAKKEFDRLLSDGQYTRLSPSETAWLVSGEEKITDTFLSLLEKAEKDGAGHLEEISQQVKGLGLKVDTVLSKGDPADEVIKTAERVKAKLIIVGSKGLKGGKPIPLGGVVRKISRYAPCSVLVIRPGRPGKEG